MFSDIGILYGVVEKFIFEELIVIESFLFFPFIQVGDCLGTLIKTFKASFLPFFDELSSYITPMLVSSSSPFVQ